jgi:hypothetical protein
MGPALPFGARRRYFYRDFPWVTIGSPFPRGGGFPAMSGPVVAFSLAVGVSTASAAVGAILCHAPFARSRRLLVHGTRTDASIVDIVPKHAVGQEFPSDAARLVVEFEVDGAMRRETITLTRTLESDYRVGDRIVVLTASSGRLPRTRTVEEPNICYGSAEQILGAVLLICAALPYFIMLSVHALTP